MPNWKPKTNVSVAVGRGADGHCPEGAVPITVRAEYLEYNAARDTAEPTRSRHGAKLLYAVEDGLATLVGIEKVKGDDVSASATGFGFLRCVAAAEEAISSVDRVEIVERAEETLRKQIERGRAVTDAGAEPAPSLGESGTARDSTTDQEPEETLELELEHEPA